MIILRKADERGRSEEPWLDSRHSFSFADYFDPRQMGFRALRVLNEDRVRPSSGFPTHSHRDMEIISCVLAGTLEHKDSMGTHSRITPGELQRMTAGTGVSHSEWNPSATEAVHFLQIWLLPRAKGLTPGYEQRRFDPAEQLDRLRLVASPDGRDGSLTVHQDVAISAARLSAGRELRYRLEPGRHAWVQVTAGRLAVGPQVLEAGDGAAVSEEAELVLRGERDADLLVFDLA